MTEVQVKERVYPYTARIRDMVKLFGIPEHTIRRMADEGKIRSLKMGNSRQGQRVYFVEDMIEYLKTNVR